MSMNLTLSPLTRRALALLILSVMVVLAWMLVAQPVIGLATGRQADIAALSEQLSQLKTIAARMPELDERATQMKTRFAASGGFWTGASVAATAASIQNLIRRAAVSGGGQLRSASEGAETVDHGFRRVTVRFGVEGTYETVLQTLAAVEKATPSLFAESVTIHSGENGFGRDRPPMMNLELTVVGYLEPPRS